MTDLREHVIDLIRDEDVADAVILRVKHAIAEMIRDEAARREEVYVYLATDRTFLRALADRVEALS